MNVRTVGAASSRMGRMCATLRALVKGVGGFWGRGFTAEYAEGEGGRSFVGEIVEPAMGTFDHVGHADSTVKIACFCPEFAGFGYVAAMFFHCAEVAELACLSFETAEFLIDL